MSKQGWSINRGKTQDNSQLYLIIWDQTYVTHTSVSEYSNNGN